MTTATIYLPATDDRPVEPAPYLLTGEDAIRFLRLGGADPQRTLQRYRSSGRLKAVQVGKQLRYTLPDLVAFIERTRQTNPR